MIASPPRGDILVALAQISTCPGQLSRNVSKHLEMAQRARDAGARLLVFPELSVTGYLLAHGVHELAMDRDDPRLEPLFAASRDLAMIVGVPLRLRGGGIANAALLLEDGELRGVHAKLYLPTYGMFDEGRYFVPGRRLEALTCALGRLGVLVCEDAWHLSSAVLLARRDVDAFVIVAGGPTELDAGPQAAGARRWHAIVTAIGATLTTPVFFANRCGWEEGVMFGGGTWAVDGRGSAVVEPAPALSESLVLAPLSFSAVQHVRSLHPIPHAERMDLWRSTLEKDDA